MYFFEQLLYEQEYEYTEDDVENVPDPDQVESEEDIIAVPIKKYILIKKLFALNDKLNRLRVKNDVLNLVINFVDSFSYESLLLITRGLADEIAMQIKSQSGKDPEQVTA